MEKILVVDDEYSNRLLIKNILNEYEVTCAENGKEMWKLLRNELPSIILLDVMMPDEDGFEIAKKITNNDNYMNIPILFITAKSDPEDVAEGFRSGGYDYVKKPFDELELKARIKSILEKKKIEIRLRNESVTDTLTNIYNRRYFIDTVEKELEYIKRYKKNISIAILDLDYFKKINDTYGHLAGDFILKEFAESLKNSIRPYDLLARYGGEEFVLSFSGYNKEETMNILQRIKEKIEKNVFYYEDHGIQFTFSGGISDTNEISSSKLSFHKLIKLADERLYYAKENGRNKIINC